MKKKKSNTEIQEARKNNKFLKLFENIPYNNSKVGQSFVMKVSSRHKKNKTWFQIKILLIDAEKIWRFLYKNKFLELYVQTKLLYGNRFVREGIIGRPNFIFSIYKKGQIRENRIERKIKSTIEDINCFLKYL